MADWKPEDAVAHYLTHYNLKVLDQMETVRHPAAALRFISDFCAHVVIDNLPRFRLLDERVALRLIDLGYARIVTENLGRFNGLDEEVALRLISLGYHRTVELNAGSFGVLGHRTALALLVRGEGATLARLINYFTGVDHDEMAQRLIDGGCIQPLVDNLSSFRHLSVATARKMIELKFGRRVALNMTSFLYDEPLVLRLCRLGYERELARFK